MFLCICFLLDHLRAFLHGILVCFDCLLGHRYFEVRVYSVGEDDLLLEGLELVEISMVDDVASPQPYVSVLLRRRGLENFLESGDSAAEIDHFSTDIKDFGVVSVGLDSSHEVCVDADKVVACVVVEFGHDIHN